MRYRSAWSGIRFGLMALACGQLAACTAGATRSAGATIGGLGALVVMMAIDPDCDPDDGDLCPNDTPYYEEETLETRTALIAGGGVAMLVGGGLVAAAQPKKRKRAAPKPAPPAVTVQPPPSPGARQMRALIEKRCAPEGSLDLRVPQDPAEPRAPLPPCD